jgi:hypothetical protein
MTVQTPSLLLTYASGPALLHRHHGDSNLVVTSLAANAEIAVTVAVNAASALPAAAVAPPAVVVVEILHAGTTAVNVITTDANARDPAAQTTVSANATENATGTPKIRATVTTAIRLRTATSVKVGFP